MRNYKKGWKGYSLEFILLFMAVSLGFIADNFREKISERNKEKEYIQSMIEDVIEDKINIDKAIKINDQRSIFLDSLMNKCFTFRGSKREVINLNQYFAQVLIHPEFITPSESTMEQLKNAGGMRLIKSKKAINEIIRYDTQIKKIANQQLYYEKYQNKAIDIGTRIFNLQKLIFLFEDTSDSESPDDFKLINTDRLQLKELGNSVVMYKGIIEYYSVLLKEMAEQGKVLTQTLNKEYKLK